MIAPFHFSTRVALTAAALAVLTAVLLPGAAQSQSIGRVEQTDSNAPSYFYYVQPGSATIQTHVLGTVRHPGLYVVNRGTTLDQVLALSGGAVLNEREGRSVRRITLRLLRDTGNGQQPIFETTYQDGRLNTAGAPPMRDGDVVDVEVVERRRFGLRSTLTVVNTLALLTLALERVGGI
jgi:hypothetical protein